MKLKILIYVGGFASFFWHINKAKTMAPILAERDCVIPIPNSYHSQARGLFAKGNGMRLSKQLLKLKTKMRKKSKKV